MKNPVRYSVFGVLLTLLPFYSGCSGYEITVQGINLDHLAKSMAVEADEPPPPTSAAYYNDLGVVLEREKNLKEALKQYRIALQKDPDLTVAYLNAGNVWLKLNNPDQAIVYYRTGLKLEPNHPRLLNNLAWAYILKDENLDQAIALLQKSLAADPEHHYRYLDSLGWARYRQGQTEEAITILQTALEETPPENEYLRGETHYHLGLVYYSEGNYEKARPHLEKGLEFTPPCERQVEINNLLDIISKDCRGTGDEKIPNGK